MDSGGVLSECQCGRGDGWWVLPVKQMASINGNFYVNEQ